MAVNKKKALELYNSHHESMPIQSIKEADVIIECSAQLGHDTAEMFVSEDLCDKLIISLRKRGFVVRYVKFQSNENWRLIEVDWLAEEFTQ